MSEIIEKPISVRKSRKKSVKNDPNQLKIPFVFEDL